MGVVADAALAAGGEVIGVTPRGLWGDEIDHPGLTELIQVGSMHERKQRMFELADAFVALPGGLGTLDELAEVATWSQLGVHRKPIVTLDVNGYWSGLHAFLRASAAAGLLKQQNLDLIVNVTDGPAGLLPALRSYVAPPAGKRINGKPLRQLAVSHTNSPWSSEETRSRSKPSFSRTRNEAVFHVPTVDQSRLRPVAIAAMTSRARSTAGLPALRSACSAHRSSASDSVHGCSRSRGVSRWSDIGW
jgi:uncharacterized protein (TIGR00730 family)